MGYESVTPPLVRKQSQKTRSQAYGGQQGKIRAEEHAVRAKARAQATIRVRPYVREAWEHAGSRAIKSHNQSRQAAQLVTWRNRGIAALRIVAGCLWACDAWFKWQGDFTHNFASYFAQSIHSQTPPVAAWLTFWLYVVNMSPHFFAHGVAIAETCIACCLLFGMFTNLACGVGIVLSLSGWSVVDSFGGLAGHGTIDMGIVIVSLLILLALMLSEAGQHLGIDRFLATAFRRRRTLQVSDPVKQQRETSTRVRQWIL